MGHQNRKLMGGLTLVLLISACAIDQDQSSKLEFRLPTPISNNAVALVGDTAFSFAGLLSGKTWKDITARAFACDLTAKNCREIAGLPDGVGRLASAAVTVQDKIYILGGYTVAKDGTEVSTPEVWTFDANLESYAPMASMPVPVDDAVALVYQERYVFVISGWHDKDNVDLVQVLDVQENRWFTATNFPGAPVFGHAGGVVGNVMLVCDGVKVVPPASESARRTFEISPACWRGEIAMDDPAKITWSLAGSILPARYRMAATGTGDAIWFAGGSDNPYNYNGIGYNKRASKPDNKIWKYEIKTGKFSTPKDKPLASMDHRGMFVWNNQFIILGGMGEQQHLLDTVQIFE